MPTAMDTEAWNRRYTARHPGYQATDPSRRGPRVPAIHLIVVPPRSPAPLACPFRRHERHEPRDPIA